MTNNQNPAITTQTKEFTDLFRSLPRVNRITPWIDQEAVGLSVIRDYPDGISFIPAKNSSDEKDSVALIKIGYLAREVKDNKITLVVRISKQSQYLLGEHWDYNFEDSKSPTRASIEESKASKQPFDLEELSRYQYSIDNKQFYDLRDKEQVEPSTIIDKIYKLHLKTIDDPIFRTKVKLKEKGISFTDPTKKFLSNLNYWLFGRQIKESKDFAAGIFKPYSDQDLVDLTTEKIKLLGSDLPVTNQTARTFIFFLLIIFLTKYYSGYDILGLYNLIQYGKDNNLLLITLVTGALFIFDRVFPRVIFKLINFLVKMRLLLIRLQIKIE